MAKPDAAGEEGESTRSGLCEIAERQESQTFERKRSLALWPKALESLCGMLNADTAEGTVVFGIAPDGQVVGVEPGDLDKAQRSLSQRIGNKFAPPIQCNLMEQPCGDKQLLVLSARRNRDVPYHEYDGRAFIREGTATRQLTLAEKNSMQRSRNRDLHPGPWRCDRCGSVAGQLFSMVLSDKGIAKSYACPCGGEYWPAT